MFTQKEKFEINQRIAGHISTLLEDGATPSQIAKRLGTTTAHVRRMASGLDRKLVDFIEWISVTSSYLNIPQDELISSMIEGGGDEA